MRLIDADALLKKVVPKNSEAQFRCVSVNDIVNAPTVKAQPRTGKWIIKDNPGTGWYRVTCSECCEDVTSTAPCIGFYPNVKITWDYCPNCGARMKEGD